VVIAEPAEHVQTTPPNGKTEHYPPCVPLPAPFGQGRGVQALAAQDRADGRGRADNSGDTEAGAATTVGLRPPIRGGTSVSIDRYLGHRHELHGALGRVVVNAETHPSDIHCHIIDAIRRDLTEFLVDEVAYSDQGPGSPLRDNRYRRF
jgi:hypothetical protein